MSENVKVRYIWDKETFLEASGFVYQHELKHSPKRFLGWVFIAMTQFGVVAAMKKGSVILLLFSTILVVYWYFLRWPLRKKILLKNFDKTKIKNKSFDILIDKDGIHYDGETTVWENITKVVKKQKGYLLYMGRNFLYLPKNGFLEEGGTKRFNALAKNRIQYFIEE